MLPPLDPTLLNAETENGTGDVGDLSHSRECTSSFMKWLAPKSTVQFLYPDTLLFGTREDQARSRPLVPPTPEFGNGSGYHGMGITGRSEEEIMRSMPPPEFVSSSSDGQESDASDVSPSHRPVRTWKNRSVVFRPTDYPVGPEELATPPVGAGNISSGTLMLQGGEPSANDTPAGPRSTRTISPSWRRESLHITDLIHDVPAAGSDTPPGSDAEWVQSHKRLRKSHVQTRVTPSSSKNRDKAKAKDNQRRPRARPPSQYRLAPAVYNRAEIVASRSPSPPPRPCPQTSTSAPTRRAVRAGTPTKASYPNGSAGAADGTNVKSQVLARGYKNNENDDDHVTKASFVLKKYVPKEGRLKSSQEEDNEKTPLQCEKMGDKFRCTLGDGCTQEFTRKNDVGRHQRTASIHLNARKFICRHCKRRFPRKDTLKRHEDSCEKSSNKNRS